MERRRQPVPAQPRGSCRPARAPGSRAGAAARRRPRRRAAREVAVRGAAAQEHVLAVVEPEAFLLDRERRAAEPRPRLEQRHRRAGVGAFERRRDPRQAASDDDDAASCAPAPTRLRAATQPFSQPGSESRPASTDSGSPLDPAAAAAGRSPPSPRRTRRSAGRAAARDRARARTTSRARVRPRSGPARRSRRDPAVLDAQPNVARSSAADTAGRSRGPRDVAQDVRQLERDTEVVGERHRARSLVGRAEDAEREPPDRPADPAAVDDEIVERRVRRCRRTSISAPSISSLERLDAGAG